MPQARSTIASDVDVGCGMASHCAQEDVLIKGDAVKGEQAWRRCCAAKDALNDVPQGMQQPRNCIETPIRR